MKLALAAWAMMTAAATAALAQDADWRPEFIKLPTDAQILAAFPPQALAEGKSGRAFLECVATAKGELTNCVVRTEDPAESGFGEAALKVSVFGRIKTKDRKGASVAGRPVTIGFRFMAPGDSDPRWLRRPNEESLASVFPTAAVKKGVDGKAVINCGITVEGFLETCKVVSETPEGLGFGAAALQLSPQFRLSPKIENGQPVASRVTIPVNWSGLEALRFNQRVRVLHDPPWTSAPTAQDVRLAWPTKQTGKVATATIRCHITVEGRLRYCETIAESPKRAGFGWAAEELSQKFTVRVTPENAESVADFVVDIPFRFRNPTEPDTRTVTQPKWIETLSPESLALVFPAAAKAANLSEGRGTINCLVDAGGGLSDCSKVAEDPEGLGFGDAAIVAAGYMKMNPWSGDGDPLDGLRVTLPIKLQFIDRPSEPPQ